MSTIMMRVDLECPKCHKKIRKVLCKIQDKVSIRTINYDERSKTVTISGPFDADDVADRLTSDARKVITDIHVVGGSQKHVVKGSKPGKSDGHGHGHNHGGGGGKADKGHGGHGGHGGGGKQEIMGYGGGGGGKQEMMMHGGYGGGGGGKADKGHSGYGGGGGKQDKGHGGYGGGGKQDKGHGGGKPDKKQVKFDFSDTDDDDFFDDEPDHHHGGGHGGKPKIITTTSTPIAARLDAPRTGPSMAMSAAAPMRMPPGMGPQMQMQPQPQAMAVPSIWPAPAAPEWGYSAPQYGSHPAGGGYYGVPAAAYGHGGYGAPAYGYGRNPYGPPQYYDEEPSAGCSVM